MVAVTMFVDCGLVKRRIFKRDDDCRNWNLLFNGYRVALIACTQQFDGINVVYFSSLTFKYVGVTNEHW
ncbi:hypothetical protein L1987_80628 [Smallanthus sonchifolius]|uniref:Uncharacterized protein n=1 Tax=Smallanthus sonchifolius TaxID=185202 RepID=A0ACB8YND7_9ASTR|nr:hypothetical protein L1987_80628 [Smallanthus sonchifolius]